MSPTVPQCQLASGNLNLLSTSAPVWHHQIVIVGGGAAGITTAAQLLKQNRTLDVAIIEPSDKHYYQPGWTLVGGGIASISRFMRNQRDVIPKEAKWIQDYVVTLDPDNNAVITGTGKRVEYDYLVLCPGIQIDWHRIKGLEQIAIPWQARTMVIPVVP